MRLELTARHITLTPAVRKMVETRLATTLRMLNDHAVSAQVVLTREKARFRVEVTLHARGENFLHGNGTGQDIAASVAMAMDKVDRQASRLKGKWDGRRRRGAPKGLEPEVPAPEPIAPAARIVRARRYAIRPMSVEEAAQVVGDTPDAFIVFRNTANDEVAVAFRRPDGNIGLIEPGA